MQQLQKLREELRDVIGQEPTDEQWASAAKLDKQTLKRQLLLSRAARNKLIQVSMIEHFTLSCSKFHTNFYIICMNLMVWANCTMVNLI